MRFREEEEEDEADDVMEEDDGAEGAGALEGNDEEEEEEEHEQREKEKLSKKARFDAAYDSGELRAEARGKKPLDADADADLEGKSAEQKASYVEELRAELEMQAKVQYIHNQVLYCT